MGYGDTMFGAPPGRKTVWEGNLGILTPKAKRLGGTPAQKAARQPDAYEPEGLRDYGVVRPPSNAAKLWYEATTGQKDYSPGLPGIQPAPWNLNFGGYGQFDPQTPQGTPSMPVNYPYQSAAPQSAQSVHPRNRGLHGLLERLQRFNRGDRTALGTLSPERSAEMDRELGLNSGVIAYVDGLRKGGGLQTNFQAAQTYADTGYMPHTTVGGAWGQRGPDIETLMHNRRVRDAANATPFTEKEIEQSEALTARMANRNWGTPERPTIVGTINGRPSFMAPPTDPGEIAASNARTDRVGSEWAKKVDANGDPIYNYDPDKNRLEYVGQWPALTHTPVVRGQRAREVAADRQARGIPLGGGSETYLADVADRKANVRERGLIRGEARRIQRGDLSMAEMERLGVPGLAVAQEQRGGMRDVAGIQAGLGEKQIAAAREMQQATLDLERFKTEGNWREAGKMQRKIGKLQRDLAKTQGEYGLQGIAMQTEAGVSRAEGEGRRSDRSLDIQERQANIQMAQQYRDRAQAALASGDYDGYQRNNQMADQLMPQMPAQPGLPTGQPAPQGGGAPAAPQSWSQIPMAMRQQIKGASPEEMVSNLRMALPGLPQEVADDMIQEAWGPNSSTMYNPDGYGLSDFAGGVTGLENINRISRWASGRGPQPPTAFGAPIPVIPGMGWYQTALGY